jgi:hypothetical protein
MNHAKTSVNTEIFVGAIISVVQYLAPIRYAFRNVQLEITRPPPLVEMTGRSHKQALSIVQASVRQLFMILHLRFVRVV